MVLMGISDAKSMIRTVNKRITSTFMVISLMSHYNFGTSVPVGYFETKIRVIKWIAKIAIIGELRLRINPNFANNPIRHNFRKIRNFGNFHNLWNCHFRNFTNNPIRFYGELRNFANNTIHFSVYFKTLDQMMFCLKANSIILYDSYCSI